jgi:hypothetical protein
MVDVLLGLQWGDEGKGKVVDFFAPRYDVIARFQGGPNAGHTLYVNGELEHNTDESAEYIYTIYFRSPCTGSGSNTVTKDYERTQLIQRTIWTKLQISRGL